MGPPDRPIRKRMVRVEIPDGVRFITFSCQKQLPLLRNAALARLFLDRLAHVREESGVRLFAYVVMPEHVHLLLAPTRAMSLDRVLSSIKQPIAIAAIARWRELNAPILARIAVPSGHRFWRKGGGFDRNVRDETEFTKTVRYIHENPVERGLVPKAEDYEFSSAQWWLSRHLGTDRPCGPGVVPCDDPPGKIDWRAWRGFMA